MHFSITKCNRNICGNLDTTFFCSPGVHNKFFVRSLIYFYGLTD